MNRPPFRQLLAQAEELCEAGRDSEAVPIYEQLLAEPSFPKAHLRLGQIAVKNRRFDLAELHFREAQAADPVPGEAQLNLAVVYLQTRRPALARDLLEELSSHTPQSADVWLNLGIARYQVEDFDNAITALNTALTLQPALGQAYYCLAIVHLMTFHWQEAVNSLCRAAELIPTPYYWSNYLLLSMFSPDASASQLAHLAEAWDARFAASARPESPHVKFQHLGRDPERPLRVGYVSPKFFGSSIGLMIEPVLANHDPRQFSVHLYSDSTVSDKTTERLRGVARVFRQTAGFSDEQLVSTIMHDGIDILIDLNAHLPDCRLGVFARRAAPVQVTYLAYPFTTGLRSMDYRVTDSVLDSPGIPSPGPEALLRLRAPYWIYRPLAGAPDPPRRLPARSVGRFTFGNFNSTQKLNQGVAAKWAEILNQIPNSRLTLFAGPAGQKPYVTELFSSAGLDALRLQLVGHVAHREYLERFLDVDLCLDPFPYGGHTTTLDALWMGVPVLTLSGSASYCRGATSILPRVGLDELVMHSVDEYQATALALARDRSRLERLRKNLRERMRSSVLSDERAWVVDYERGLRQAWLQYCQGLPPTAIDFG